MAFSQMIGQQRAIRALKAVGRRENLPHAFLFTGLPGIGKKTAALNFAKLINCENPVENDCCEKCSACKRANNGNYPDLRVIESTNQYIKIDVIRELVEQFRFKPIEGRKRVIIFDDSQKMTEEAANALLKSLEEPPSYNLIILLAPEPAMLLSTVVSRTCQLRFQPLSEKAIAETLVKNRSLTVNKAKVLAEVADGSLDRVFAFLEHGFLDTQERLLNTIRTVHDHEVVELFDLAKKWIDEKSELLSDLDVLKLWWRDLIVYYLTDNQNLIINKDIFITLSSIMPHMKYSSLFDIFWVTDSVQRDIIRNGNKLMAIERLILALKENMNEEDSRHTFSGERENI